VTPSDGCHLDKVTHATYESSPNAVR
jgi:hypothetical protein